MNLNNLNLKSNTKLNAFFSNHLGCLLAFIIPVIVMISIFISREIYPWGEQMYLRSDMYHQYAPFYKELFGKLTNGESLTYSWDIGMGVNFTALYAYYLASPINLFIGFLPANHIPEIMGSLIILKIGLASFATSYYVKKHFNTNSPAIAVIGIFYGLSSYFAAFSWNIMWLDCMILLPIILLGLERLVKENKTLLYCISLALCIFSNYYIAIMICIFVFLYFIVLLVSDDNNKKDKDYYLKRFFNFSLYSLIAGGIAAIILIPELFALSRTASGEFNFPETLVNYFSFLDMASRSLINVDPAIFAAHDPNLYSTVGVFIFLPLYALSKNVNPKEKAAKIILVVFFLLSFNTNILTYIWHGFHFPNSLPCRQSFIYIFLTLIMCFEAMKNITEYTSRQIFSVFAGACGLIFLIEEFYVSDTYSFEIIYYSLAILAMHLLLIVTYRNQKEKRMLVIYLLIVLAIAETYINTDATSISPTSRTAYVSDNESVDKLLTQIDKNDDSLFYRIEKYTRRTKNDAAWHGYMGVSTFSSTASAYMTDFLGLLGHERSTNAYSFYGHTPLTASMLSVKYMLSNQIYADDFDYRELVYSDDEFKKYVYKYKNTLPLGFYVPKNINKDWYFEGNNPFAIQNSFVYTTTGIEELFTQIPIDVYGTSNTIVAPDNSIHLYAYVVTSTEGVSVTITNEDGTHYSNKTYSGLKHKQIIDIGSVPANATVLITPTDSDLTSLQMYAYTFDNKKFESAFEILNKTSLELTKFEETLLEGKITTKEDGLLYTSINYEKGWTAYVNGEKVDTVPIKNAVIGIPITKGENVIKLTYTPEGLLLGSFISFASLLALLTLVYIHKKEVLSYYRTKFKKTKTPTANTTE